MVTISQIREMAGKFKYVLIVIAAGIILMLLPEQESTVHPEPQAEIPAAKTIQDALEEILGAIQGVGKVRVLLTEAQGSRTVYVFDESESADSRKADAVILTDTSRAQTGMVAQVIPPVYQGAIVVCQGGDSPSVRLAVVEAVCDATGLTADKITVLKMK